MTEYTDAGAYLEQIFPFLNIRFIAVNDNYDSKNNENGIVGLDIPFKNLAHDYYSKDISQKIRSSVKVRQKKGYYFGSKAPYGYIKDEKNHHQLLVDERVRHIIQEIFERYLSGKSMRSIAKDLNEREILTPGKHTGLQQGDGIWTGEIVRETLINEVYFSFSACSQVFFSKSPLISCLLWISLIHFLAFVDKLPQKSAITPLFGRILLPCRLLNTLED